MSLQAYDLRDPASVLKAVRHSNVVINLVGRDYETRSASYHRYLVVRREGEREGMEGERGKEKGWRGQVCMDQPELLSWLDVTYIVRFFWSLACSDVPHVPWSAGTSSSVMSTSTVPG